jgi:hypothetical protein
MLGTPGSLYAKVTYTENLQTKTAGPTLVATMRTISIWHFFTFENFCVRSIHEY